MIELTVPDEARNLRQALEKVFPYLEICERSRFVFMDRFIRQAINRNKTTTIRYSRSAVEYPGCSHLPVFSADRETEMRERVGFAEVYSVAYKTFGELDQVDARRDGFASTEELRGALSAIYGQIAESEVVSIFHLSVVDAAVELLGKAAGPPASGYR